jgi:predicted Rdx family selenoprotein
LIKKGFDDVTIRPGKSGQFDIVFDGVTRYSKADTGRFPTDAEVDALA